MQILSNIILNIFNKIHRETITSKGFISGYDKKLMLDDQQ